MATVTSAAVRHCIGANAQWHAGLLAQYGGLDRLRSAEKSAKDKRIGLWEGYTAPRAAYASGGGSGAAASGDGTSAGQGGASTKGQSFDAVVTRIWGSDQLSIAPKGQEEQERRVQLASVRGPRGTGGREAYYANEAKE
jgi:staphylococcal nuclease domain-containing protein 1